MKESLSQLHQVLFEKGIPFVRYSLPGDKKALTIISYHPFSFEDLDNIANQQDEGFVFAPFPYNSRSIYLKFKALLLRTLLRPFVNLKIIKLAYFPLGGKAEKKTHAKVELSIQDLAKLFYKARMRNKFDWYVQAHS